MRKDKLECGQLHQVTQSADISALPDNAVLLESLSVTAQPEGSSHVLTFPDSAKQYHAVRANFGQDLQAAAQCGPKDARCELQGKRLCSQQKSSKHCTAECLKVMCIRCRASLQCCFALTVNAPAACTVTILNTLLLHNERYLIVL